MSRAIINIISRPYQLESIWYIDYVIDGNIVKISYLSEFEAKKDLINYGIYDSTELIRNTELKFYCPNLSDFKFDFFDAKQRSCEIPNYNDIGDLDFQNSIERMQKTKRDKLNLENAIEELKEQASINFLKVEIKLFKIETN